MIIPKVTFKKESCYWIIHELFHNTDVVQCCLPPLFFFPPFFPFFSFFSFFFLFFVFFPLLPRFLYPKVLYARLVILPQNHVQDVCVT